jgi:hypothetical protein
MYVARSRMAGPRFLSVRQTLNRWSAWSTRIRRCCCGVRFDRRRRRDAAVATRSLTETTLLIIAFTRSFLQVV